MAKRSPASRAAFIQPPTRSFFGPILVLFHGGRSSRTCPCCRGGWPSPRRTSRRLSYKGDQGNRIPVLGLPFVDDVLEAELGRMAILLHMELVDGAVELIHVLGVPVAHLGLALRTPVRPDAELRVAIPIRNLETGQRFKGGLNGPGEPPNPSGATIGVGAGGIGGMAAGCVAWPSAGTGSRAHESPMAETAPPSTFIADRRDIFLMLPLLWVWESPISRLQRNASEYHNWQRAWLGVSWTFVFRQQTQNTLPSADQNKQACFWLYRPGRCRLPQDRFTPQLPRGRYFTPFRCLYHPRL